MRGNRYRRQVAARKTGFLVTEEVVEYFSTRSRSEGPWKFRQAAIARKFLDKTESAGRDLRFDPSEIGGSRGYYTAGDRSSAHGDAPIPYRHGWLAQLVDESDREVVPPPRDRTEGWRQFSVRKKSRTSVMMVSGSSQAP